MRLKAVFAFAMLLMFLSCFKHYKDRVSIDGSSSVYLISEAVAEEFRNKYPDIKVMVGVSGTGGGFKKFARAEIDICDASRPITTEEMKACKENGIEFIEIPVSYDGIAVVINPNNDFVDYLTVAELKTIWEPASQNRVKTWKQVRSSWPDMPLNLYGAGTASGTYDYFTLAVVGKAKASRGDYSASEDDNVLVQGVSRDNGALGYFGLAYYLENKSKLKLVPIDDKHDDNGTGPIFPTDSTIYSGTYQPLTRPEFIYVNAKSAQRPAIKTFIAFYLKHAAILVKEVGYVPLQEEAYIIAYRKFEAGQTGSMFTNTSLVGVDIIDMLKSAQKQK